jgi:hypothetical protein
VKEKKMFEWKKPCSATLAIASLLLVLPNAAIAKKNLAYYIDAPASVSTPIIGKITAARMKDLADSDLTHIVFGFGNICTADLCGQFANSGITGPIVV